MRSVVIAAAGAAICALLVTASRPAAADILVNVSKSSQRMSVLVDGTVRHNWMVSTGAQRYTTPSGVYKPQWLARKWRSKQYANAPMPHSIFFHKGYAIHGTTEVARLGKIGSHGCVRLHPDNAAKLYSLVQSQMANTRVVVSDDAIQAPGEAPKLKPSQFVAQNAVKEEPAIKPAPPVKIAAAPIPAVPQIAAPAVAVAPASAAVEVTGSVPAKALAAKLPERQAPQPAAAGENPKPASPPSVTREASKPATPPAAPESVRPARETAKQARESVRLARETAKQARESAKPAREAAQSRREAKRAREAERLARAIQIVRDMPLPTRTARAGRSGFSW